MDKEQEDKLTEMVQDLDQLIMKYQLDLSPHGISGILLSRVTLLMSEDPDTGKGLLRFVWEKLDELQQSNPGQFL